MSRSSNAAALPMLPGSSDDPARTRARILAGIAWECAAMGREIAELGDALSEDRMAIGDSARMENMQAFDRLTQAAHAQAQILAHIARDILMERSTDSPEMLELINSVPIHDVRMRLREALGAMPNYENVESGSADLWDDAAEAQS